MLAYAASRPVLVDRSPHPNTMLLIIGAHVAVLAAVMSAKMEVQRHRPTPTTVVSIPLPPEPPPNTLPEQPRSQPTVRPSTDHSHVIVKTPPNADQPEVDTTASGYDPGQLTGASTVGAEVAQAVVKPPAPTGARLLTPASELKPPYPASKLLNEEEAVLTLKLTIDADGRVTSVEPVGHVDAIFLEAARRHLIAHWRYAPATQEGHAVGSTAVVTLHFELNG